jgi:formylglycine-generating enzyme required for sulfatase activity
MPTRYASATALIGIAALTLMGPRPAGSAQTSVVAQVVDLGWIRVPAGTFQMGCVESDTSCLDNERPGHEVTFLEPFDLMGAEATIAQYAQFVADSGHPVPPSPEFPQAADHPVVLVNWDDAADFCEWAGGRLPTEAEWEYAARGGQAGLVYGTSQELSRDQVNYGADRCCSGATGGGDAWVNTAPVRSFPPNDFGVYDMTGNVWEWVDGWLDDDYYASSPPINPPGAATGYSRIARGGSWLNFAAALRTSVRLPFAQTGQTSNVGVRCAKGLPTARAD